MNVLLFICLPLWYLTGNTKDKIISELDKIQLEVTEHMEESRDHRDRMNQDVHRFKNMLLVEMGDCRRSGDGLEKRLSKLEGVCGRLTRVSDTIDKIREGLALAYISFVILITIFHFLSVISLLLPLISTTVFPSFFIPLFSILVIYFNSLPWMSTKFRMHLLQGW